MFSRKIKQQKWISTKGQKQFFFEKNHARFRLARGNGQMIKSRGKLDLNNQEYLDSVCQKILGNPGSVEGYSQKTVK
jgi:hypothetical protein